MPNFLDRRCLRWGFMCFLILGLFGFAFASTQEQGERTFEEVKEEAIKRAENGMYPLIALDPADVREAFSSLDSMDNDEWARAFSNVAGRYMAQAKEAEKTDPFGRWPVPSSPGKKEAYARALEAFHASARLQDPPIETVKIPFQGLEIIGYLRLPKNGKGPVPVVLGISGLDSRKEDMAANYGAILQYGLGYLAIDSPGTGQAPIKAGESSERMLSRALDYLATRPEVDKTRIGAVGQSFGAYWATKLAIVDHDRLRAVVAQSPPVDFAFRKDFLEKRLHGNREYLFGMSQAMSAILENGHGAEDVMEQFPKLSLVTQGLLGKPTAPMLIIAGALDTQVPVDDAYLLLSNGDVPKEAWINPKGGHLGRQVKVYPDPVILRTVIVPWLVRKLGMEDAPKATQ